MHKNQIKTISITRRDLLKYAFYGTFAGGLSGNFLFGGCVKKKKKPNIFLVTVDTLRADHLGCYGYHRNTSPNIDAFAKDSLLFENCISHASDTRLSFASLLSGFYPHETQITKQIQLRHEVDTLPKILQREGYKTIAVVSNYVLHKGEGWEKGFDIFDDTMNQQELVRKWPERTAAPTTEHAIELIKQNRESQLFIWIHYQDPHGPYTPPGDFSRMFIDSEQKQRHIKLNNSLIGRGGIPAYQQLGKNRNFHYYVSQYDGEIRYQDQQFKRLLNTLQQLKMYDNSLIIFSSDHGEGMGEHDYFFAHGDSLHNPLIHVPLIIRYGNTLSGRRKDTVQHIDIAPTVFNFLGMPPKPDFRGHDLRQPYSEKREIFSEMSSPLVPDRYKFSLILYPLKLIYTPFYQKYELYDLHADPLEKQNLYHKPQYRKHAEDLQTRLHHLRQEDFLQIGSGKKRIKLSKEEIEKLKSLGYVQ